MKKNYFFAALTALTLASCATNEPVDDSPLAPEAARAIGFGTFLDRISQSSAAVAPKGFGVEIGDLQFASNGFKVLAYSTGSTKWDGAISSLPATPDFMNDLSVKWSTGQWTYTPLQYWPAGYVSFFSYFPVTGATTALSASASPKISFTTQEAAENQVDLVVSALLNQTEDSGQVKFKFDHILSKIGFSARVFAKSANLPTINSLKVYYKANTVVKDGTYTFSEDNTQPSIWTAGSSKFSAKTAGMGDEALAYTTPLSLDGDVPKVSDLCWSPNGKFYYTYLMLIPQQLEDGDIHVELKYELMGASYTSKIELPAVAGGFLPGKSYTYTFVIKFNLLEFDSNTSVGEWVDAEEGAETEIVVGVSADDLDAGGGGGGGGGDAS
jgi:hypothetical protein